MGAGTYADTKRDVSGEKAPESGAFCSVWSGERKAGAGYLAQ
jgi:hypothetical protein